MTSFALRLSICLSSFVALSVISIASAQATPNQGLPVNESGITQHSCDIRPWPKTGSFGIWLNDANTFAGRGFSNIDDALTTLAHYREVGFCR